MTLLCERGPPNAGFTLIELAVVLGILAILWGMAVPLLGSPTQRGALRAAAAELRAVLRGASMQAIAEGRTIVVRGDPASGYWVDRQHRRIAALGDSAEPLRVSIAGGGALAFFAWGGSSGGRVRVESPRGREEITVDAVTGRAIQRR